jgi:hypothetical protein
MSLSNPTNQNPSNPGAVKGTWLGEVAPTPSPISQIRGVSASTSVGAGIPKHVSNVSASMARGSAGTTTAVSVTYSRDPGDTAHAKVNVYVKGYQGNNSRVQVASGSESPITFVLNNTGETVSIFAQAQGNSGAAPLETAPSTGVQIPKSTGGGYGTNTNTGGASITPTPVTGQLTKFTSATSIGGANLNGDVTTANSETAIVVGLQTIPVSATTPLAGESLLYNGSRWRGDWDTFVRYIGNAPTNSGNPTGSGTTWGFNGGGWTYNGLAASPDIAASATEPHGVKFQTSAVAGSSSNAQVSVGTAGIEITLGLLKSIKFLVKLGQTTNMRMWIGVTDQIAAATFRSDTPAANFVGYRYSTAAGDTKWKCVTNTDATHQTATNESGAHLDTSLHVFEIRFDGTNAVFLIDNVQVGSQSTNLPTTSTTLGVMVAVDNVGAANTPIFTIYGMRGALAA